MVIRGLEKRGDRRNAAGKEKRVFRAIGCNFRLFDLVLKNIYFHM